MDTGPERFDTGDTGLEAAPEVTPEGGLEAVEAAAEKAKGVRRELSEMVAHNKRNGFDPENADMSTWGSELENKSFGENFRNYLYGKIRELRGEKKKTDAYTNQAANLFRTGFKE